MIKLLELVIVAVTSNNDEFKDPDKRADIIHFCKQVELVFEAAYIVASKMKQVKEKSKR